MTLYILGIDEIKEEIRKFLIISIICAMFSAIYEIFSHQVYSAFMICAFLIPLVFGGGVYYILSKVKKEGINSISNNLYKCAIYTFTICSLIKGVLDIYGTTNSLVNVYWFLGGILLVCARVSRW